MRITSYAEAFDLINVKLTGKALDKLKAIESEGYREKNICYAIWKGQEKIMSYRNDERFWSVLTNEVRKYVFKS
jgi:hypothetical protein